MSALQSDLHAASHICITLPEAQIQFHRLAFRTAHLTQDYFVALTSALIFIYNSVLEVSRLYEYYTKRKEQ
jgi:hypothetical protein